MGKTRTYSTLAVEVIGFGLLIVLLLADEIVDLPYLLFGAARTPIRISELVVEVGATLLMGAGVMVASWRINGQIAYMESLLLICGACRRLLADGQWIQFEEYIKRRNDRLTTHGVCTDCYQQVMREFDAPPQESRL